MEGIIEVYANLDSIDYVEANIEVGVNPIQLRTCTKQDLENNLFEAEESEKEDILLQLSKLYCFEDPNSIVTSGHYQATYWKGLTLSFTRCFGDHCKSNEEIDNYLTDGLVFYMYQNNQKYNPNSYDDQVIENFLSKHILLISKDS